jgi:hypothetical protein
MTTIEVIAFCAVFIIYTTSQHLLNWFFRLEYNKPSWETLIVLAMVGFIATNTIFLSFLWHMLINK